MRNLTTILTSQAQLPTRQGELLPQRLVRPEVVITDGDQHLLVGPRCGYQDVSAVSLCATSTVVHMEATQVEYYSGGGANDGGGEGGDDSDSGDGGGEDGGDDGGWWLAAVVVVGWWVVGGWWAVGDG